MAYQPWQPGMTITAGRLTSISPTWQSWTPTWTTSNGLHPPSYGNATTNCSYAVSARTCLLRFEVIFGSTTNFGTGATTADNWQFTLPVPAADVFPGIGFVELQASNAARAIARIRGLSTTTFVLELSSGRPDATAITNLGIVDSLSPWTWASGHTIRGTAAYETAS